MIELAVTIIIIIVYTLYRIYCFAMRQSAKEEEFWANRRIFYNDLFTRIYAIAKIALLIFVIACAILLFTTLAYGETPSLRDFRNPKFLELLLGASILAFPQCGFIWLYRRFKKGQRPGPVGVIFFLLIAGFLGFGLFAFIYLLFTEK